MIAALGAYNNKELKLLPLIVSTAVLGPYSPYCWELMFMTNIALKIKANLNIVWINFLAKRRIMNRENLKTVFI
jgi:hypothetical protein